MHKPSATQTLLWDIATASLKLRGIREGTSVDRIATLCELRDILQEAIDMCDLAIEQLEAEIPQPKEGEGEQLAFQLKESEAS